MEKEKEKTSISNRPKSSECVVWGIRPHQPILIPCKLQFYKRERKKKEKKEKKEKRREREREREEKEERKKEKKTISSNSHLPNRFKIKT